MDYLFMSINDVWPWLGPPIALGLLVMAVVVIRGTIRQEIRWWRTRKQ